MTSEFVLVVQIAGTNITDKMYKFLTIYGQQHMDYLEAGLKKGKGKKAGATSKEKASTSTMIATIYIYLLNFMIGKNSSRVQDYTQSHLPRGAI